MITVNFGQINKKVNSTNNVFIGESTDVDVVLKSDTSIIKPVFVVNIRKDSLDEKDWFTFNYCYCEEFHRYYWIDDIVINSNYMLEIYCHVDVLGTYYDMIKDQPLFFKYCGDKTLANFALDDERLQPEIETMGQMNWGDVKVNNIDLFDNNGLIVLTCVTNLGNDSAYSSKTGIGTYIMSCNTLKDLFGNLNGFWGKWGAQEDGQLPQTISGISDAMQWISHFKDVLAATNNAKEMILSCKWLPINFEIAKKYGSQVAKMYIGSLPISVDNVYVLGTGTGLPCITAYCDDGIVINADLTNYSDNEDNYLDAINLPFLWNNKYTSIKLNHPNGIQEINDNSFYNADSKGASNPLYAYVINVSLIDGNYSVKINSFSNNSVDKIVAMVSGNIAVDMMAYTQAESTTVAGDTLRFWGTAAAVSGGIAAAGSAGLGATSISQISTGTAMTTAAQAGAGISQAASAFTPNLVGLKAAARGIGVYKGISNVMASGKPSPAAASLNCNFSGISGLMSLVTTPILGTKIWKNGICITTYSILPSVIINGEYSAYGKQFGFPCGKILTLEDITVGDDPVYVETVNASIGEISILGWMDGPWPTPEELASINDALNSGIYVYPGG